MPRKIQKSLTMSPFELRRPLEEPPFNIDEKINTSVWLNIPQCLISAFETNNQYSHYMMSLIQTLQNKMVLINQLMEKQEEALGNRFMEQTEQNKSYMQKINRKMKDDVEAEMKNS